MHDFPLWAWIAFLAFVALMLALDLGVFRRKGHVIGVREALVWCVVWMTLALGFNALVWWWQGKQAALEFLAGYLVELSLSVDNVFVFILVFSFFKVPPALQHRVLFWGVLGAAVMRAVFIGAGIFLLEKLDWVIFVFGAFLIYTGIKMALPKKEEIHPDRNPAVRLFRKFFPVTADYEGVHFFSRNAAGALAATPLFIVLIVIETTDVVFAVDSIPAILAITQNAFIVFTSNIFAILGLRSFYFALAGVIQYFRYLPIGLSVVLVFIGVKMLLSNWYHIPTELSLGVIGIVLGGSVALSLLLVKRPPSATADESGPAATKQDR
jgi:tellurite resistance protein TerC